METVPRRSLCCRVLGLSLFSKREIIVNDEELTGCHVLTTRKSARFAMSDGGTWSSWVWRRRRTIAIGSAVAAGAYGAYQLWQKKRDVEDLLQSFGFLSKRRAASREAGVREHFEATQREADRILLDDAIPRLQLQISRLLDTDSFKQNMRGEGKMKDPAQWHELMVLTISRALVTQYALALVVVYVRLKLNLISRHYLLEVAEPGEAWRTEKSLSNLTKRRFLSMENL